MCLPCPAPPRPAVPLEMHVIAREHFNRWYSLKSYFLAVTLADVPLQGVCTLIYTLVVYYMPSQPLEPQRFLLFLLICALVSFVAQSLGLLIGAAMEVQVSSSPSGPNHVIVSRLIFNFNAGVDPVR